MGRNGLKAITALLTKRQSRRGGNLTLSIAMIATLVTIGLIVLYLMLEAPGFP